MSELNSGDKVICIDDSGQSTIKLGQKYTIGTIHTTKRHDGIVSHKVWIKEHKRFAFNAKRFVKE